MLLLGEASSADFAGDVAVGVASGGTAGPRRRRNQLCLGSGGTTFRRIGNGDSMDTDLLP